MSIFFENVGLFAALVLLLYIAKKISDSFYLERAGGCPEDDRVYKAAAKFALGAPFDEIRDILANCIDFDEEDVEEILSRSSSHRADEDGGYGAFIEAVNGILGKEVYGGLRHVR